MRITQILAFLVTLFGSYSRHLWAQPIGVFTVPPQQEFNGYAYCLDPYGYVVPGCVPTLYNGYYSYTGGHVHDDPSHQIVANNFFGRVTTQPNGGTGLLVKFTASRTGEREWIDVCASTCSTTDAIVRNTNLELLYPGGNHINIGDKPWHPLNHWAERSTIDAILAITQEYANQFNSQQGYQPVGVNDIAVDYGGIFDICLPQSPCANNFVAPWQPSHHRHDTGRAVDFRANNEPNTILPAARELFTGPNGGQAGYGGWCRQFGLGTWVRLESVGTTNQHIHCDGN
jgi:hypothetical protein